MKTLIADAFRAGRDSGALSEEFEVELITAMTFNVLIEMFKVYVRSNLRDIRQVIRQSHDQIVVILRGLGARPEALDIADPDLRDWIGLSAPAASGLRKHSAG